MPIDQWKIGQIAQELMAEIEESTGDQGEIGAVCLIVEVTTPDGVSSVHTRSSEGRAHIQLGLLEIARMGIRKHLDGN